MLAPATTVPWTGSVAPESKYCVILILWTNDGQVVAAKTAPAHAKKAAAKMIEDTQARMEQELKAARNQLRSEAAELSVAMAEELLKKNINQGLHENIVKDYLDKVVKKN